MVDPNPSAPQPPAGSSWKRLMMGAVPVLILLLAWIGWTLWGPQEGPDEPPRTNAAGEPDSSSSADAQPTWTLEEARQLVSVSQQALGHLENLELEAADPPLVDLAQKLPQEPLGPRNLTICRFLAFDGGKGTRESVLESLKLLRAVQPEDAYTFWLEAKTALKESANQAADPAASEQQLRQAIIALRAAADRAPRNDAVRYQLFEAARNSNDPTLQAAGEAALEEAYQIDPDNLFTLSDWLLLQARRQDARILDTLLRARATIAPLRPLVEARSRVNLDELIGQAEQAVREQKWPVATARMRVVFVNLMRPLDAAQSDKRRLDPHPLEFAIARFSDAFYAHYDFADPVGPPMIPVHLSPFPAETQLPSLTDVRDLAVVDFDLDGKQDLILLRADRVEVYRQEANQERNSDQGASRWSMLTSLETGGSFSRLLVADLDHDRDHARTHDVITTTTADEAAAAQRRSLVCFDADPDLVLLGPSGLRVVRNLLDPMTQQRTLVPVETQLEPPLNAVRTGVLIDFDSDSNLDLVLATETGIVPLLSRGDLTFLDARSYSQLPPPAAVCQDLLVVDWDRDVDLDVVAVSPTGNLIGYLENLRHGNFRWVPLEEETYSTLRNANSLALLDADGNQAWDIVGAGADGVSLVTTRLAPNGRVVPVTSARLSIATGPATATTTAKATATATGPATATAEAAGDTNKQSATPAPRVSTDHSTRDASEVAASSEVAGSSEVAAGRATETSQAGLSSSTGRQVIPWDFDNDGFQDLLIWHVDGVDVLRGGPRAAFVAVAELFREKPTGLRRIEVADLDDDGDLDLALATESGVRLLSNEGGNRNHWLRIRAMGQVDNKGKANHNGLGSLIEVKAGSRYQAQIVNRPVTHFGMGDQTRADVVRFLWTNGVPQAIVNPATDEAVCELMILKGSCPYIYTWTGERFEFFTDLLWAAPIGLQFAENLLAPARPWEYLLIPGDRLQPRDGQYQLQLTEELWEAAYFDQVALFALDHPADIEVFSNEKVGPASIAEFHVHTARQRRTPLAARDAQGRDRLAEIRHRDGVYFRGFEQRHLPGLVNEHFLEIDLGSLDGPSAPPTQPAANSATTAPTAAEQAASGTAASGPAATRAAAPGSGGSGEAALAPAAALKTAATAVASATSSSPQATGAQPASAQPAPAQPASAQPASAQPAPAQPAPAQPASAQPAPAQPAPAQPASVQPASVQPASVQPASVQPGSAQPASAQPVSEAVASGSVGAKPGPAIRLFLHGWIYPTDTSLNVGLSRHPTLKGPRPPAIWVPDAEGQWREVMPYMGFPGGKPKTIVVDLSGLFLTNDYRVRIVTSHEIYWDEVSFTVDEQPGEVRIQPLNLVAADLHYRGFSYAYPLQPNAPEWYDYERVTTGAKWPPMQGFFTRYGDVRELLQQTDDRLLVMGAGDETTLHFAMPEQPLPAGWKRDFFLHNVGWDKDADLNTVYGQTVEPLPFQAMRSYPFPLDQAYPETAELNAYQRTYQTRQQPRDPYWRALRPTSPSKSSP